MIKKSPQHRRPFWYDVVSITLNMLNVALTAAVLLLSTQELCDRIADLLDRKR